MSELKFGSIDEAMQRLSDLTDSRIVIGAGFLKNISGMETQSNGIFLVVEERISGNNISFNSMKDAIAKVEKAVAHNKQLLSSEVPELSLSQEEDTIWFGENGFSVMYNLFYKSDRERLKEIAEKLAELGA